MNLRGRILVKKWIPHGLKSLELIEKLLVHNPLGIRMTIRNLVRQIIKLGFDCYRSAYEYFRNWSKHSNAFSINEV